MVLLSYLVKTEMKKKILLSVIILVISSTSLLGEDLIKFLLSGQSATYSVFLIRHNIFVGYLLSLLAIFLIFYLKKNKVIKYLLGIVLIIWVFSVRTIAVVKIYDTTLVYGIGIIPIYKCEVVQKDNCDIIFDIFLEEKVKKAVSD